MALSGSVETAAHEFISGTRTVILQWTAEQEYASDKTTLYWEVVGGGTYKYNAVVCELRVTIDGDVEFYKEPVSTNRVECYKGTVLASGTKVVYHNADGTRNVEMKIEAGIYEWAINKSNSATFALDPIPQPSTIGATDANIGAKSTIVVTRNGATCSHSIAYAFGDLSGYITQDGNVSASEVKFTGTSISWTVPVDFYGQISNAKSGTCTLTIKTYYGDTQIGNAKTCTFTATAAQSLCAPSVSGSVVDSNAATKALTGDDSKLVRYYSTALCTITAKAKNSATISEKKIGGTTVTGTTHSIASVEIDSVTFYAKDSRGYEASTDVVFTLIPYVILTNNPTGQRTDPTSGNAILTVDGNYFNGSFGVTSNTLTIMYRFRVAGGTYGSYTEVNPVINGNAYTANVELSGLDYEHSYEFEVVVSDRLASVTKVVTIKQGIPIFDWGQNDFRINVALRLLGASYGLSYPPNPKVGQVFFLFVDGAYAVRIYNGNEWI